MKQFMITAFLLMASSLAMENLSAQEVRSIREQTSAPNSINYLGIKDGMLLFEVHLENVHKGTFLQILDENGNELLAERIRTTSFTRHYKFEKNLFNKLQFQVDGRKPMYETFNFTYWVEEKFAVSKN